MVRTSLAGAALALLLPMISAAAEAPAASQPSTPATTSPAATPAASAPEAAATAATATPVVASTAPAGPKITYSSCHVDGPYIAMTFDDGPHVQNTPRLLDMLKQRGIKATFFLVGECVAANPQIVKRIVAEGHEIGNHSWSHPLLSKMSDGSVADQLQKTQSAIVAACGITPKLMRPPYGGFTQRQQRWANGEYGYKCILWDVDPEDWKIRNAEHVQSVILKEATSGSIILSHDIHKTTVDAMPATLDALAAKGFKFVTVSELIAMDKPKPAKPAKATADAASSPAKADAAPAKKADVPASAKKADAPAPVAATK